MGFRAWAARCIPGFSILALSFLILLALTDVPQWYQACSEPDASWRAAFASKGTKLALLDTTTPPEYVFAAYNLLIHILALLAPLRFCWSLWQITGQVRQVDARYRSGGRANSCRPGAWRRASSPATSTNLEESTNSGDDCQEKRGEGDGSLGRLRNTILLPSYKEEIENLRETLDVLASHHQAKSTYDVSVLQPLFSRRRYLDLALSPDLARNGRDGPNGEDHSKYPPRILRGSLPQHSIYHASCRPAW